MNTILNVAARPGSSVAASDIATIGAAVLMGLGLLFVAGFAEGAALHDIAHDQRHAIAFPCH